MKSTEKLQFSDNFSGNRSLWIRLNSFNNTGVGKKKDPLTKTVITFLWLIKIIPNFEYTYWDISMWIINNQYRSICRPSTSVTRWSLGLRASKNLSMIFFGILFHSSTVASFENSRTTILRLRYTFYSRSPQISKSTGFKSRLLRDEWWGSRNRSFFFQHFKGDNSCVSSSSVLHE